MIEQRYRARFTSLWLDLVPKIHRSLNGGGHLLEHSNNHSLFEENTRDVDLHIVLPPPPKTTPVVQVQSHHQSVTQPYIDSLMIVTSVTSVTTRSVTQLPRSRSILSGDTPVALSIIIIIGCALLVLNILVFAIVYYQRDRVRQRKDSKRTSLTSSSNHQQQLEVRQAMLENHEETRNHNHHRQVKTLNRHNNSKHYDSTGNNVSFSSTLWSYNVDQDRQEPVTVV